MSFHLLTYAATEDLWRKKTVHGKNIAQAVVADINQNPPDKPLSTAVVANVPDAVNLGSVEAAAWYIVFWDAENQRYEVGADQGSRRVTLIL